MIAVLFEVVVPHVKVDAYLEEGADLRALLDGHEGFISLERFRSTSTPDKFLSLSYWKDEASIEAWRNDRQHRQAQSTGRNSLFGNYTLRVASVLRGYSLHEREQAPEDSKQAHEDQGLSQIHCLSK